MDVIARPADASMKRNRAKIGPREAEIRMQTRKRLEEGHQMDVIARLRDIVEGSPGGFPPDSLFARLIDVCEAARAHRQAYDAARGTSRQDFARVYETALFLDAALARLEATDARE